MPAKDKPKPSRKFTRLFGAFLRARNRSLGLYTDPDLDNADRDEIERTYEEAERKLLAYVAALESAAQPKE